MIQSAISAIYFLLFLLVAFVHGANLIFFLLAEEMPICWLFLVIAGRDSLQQSLYTEHCGLSHPEPKGLVWFADPWNLPSLTWVQGLLGGNG